MFPVSVLSQKFFHPSSIIISPDSATPAFSCHHCGNRKRSDFLLHCKNNRIARRSKTIALTQCRKKFCHSCLRKHYNQLVYMTESEESVVLHDAFEAEDFLSKMEGKLSTPKSLHIFTNSFNYEKNELNSLNSSVPIHLTFKPTNNHTSVKFEHWSCPACLETCFCFGCKPKTKKQTYTHKPFFPIEIPQPIRTSGERERINPPLACKYRDRTIYNPIAIRIK